MTEENSSVTETNYGLENTLKNLGEKDIKFVFEKLRIQKEEKIAN